MMTRKVLWRPSKIICVFVFSNDENTDKETIGADICKGTLAYFMADDNEKKPCWKKSFDFHYIEDKRTLIILKLKTTPGLCQVSTFHSRLKNGYPKTILPSRVIQMNS